MNAKMLTTMGYSIGPQAAISNTLGDGFTPAAAWIQRSCSDLYGPKCFRFMTFRIHGVSECRFDGVAGRPLDLLRPSPILSDCMHLRLQWWCGYYL